MPTFTLSFAIWGPTDSKAARRRPGCGCVRIGLALGELVTAARLVQPDLLALHLARVARDEPRLLQRRLERRVVLDQRAGNAVADGAGLPRLAASVDVDVDIEARERIGELQRLAHDHAPGLAREELVHRLAVYRDLAGAGLQKYAGHGALAPAGAVVLMLPRLHGHDLQISRFLGCCAVCGWVAPVYIFIFF